MAGMPRRRGAALFDPLRLEAGKGIPLPATGNSGDVDRIEARLGAASAFPYAPEFASRYAPSNFGISVTLTEFREATRFRLQGAGSSLQGFPKATTKPDAV
jgi:hypothetical protein